MERSKKEYRIPEVKEVGRVAVSTLGVPDVKAIETDPNGEIGYLRQMD